MDRMRFKSVSLAICCFLFISLAAGTISSAQTEADVPGEDLPDVPRYPDTVRIYYFTSDTGTILIYRGDVGASTVGDFYESTMQRMGWSLVWGGTLAKDEEPPETLMEFTENFMQLFSEAAEEEPLREFFSKVENSTSNWIGGFQKEASTIVIVIELEGSSDIAIFYVPPVLYEPVTPSPSIISEKKFFPENSSLDLLLEFKSTGRLRIRADYSGPNPILYYYVARPMPFIRLGNNVPGSSGLFLMHHGGDTITNAIIQGRLGNLQLRINGEVVVPTTIYLNGEIVTGDKDFAVGDVIKLEGGYQLNAGDMIEVVANGKVLFVGSVESPGFAASSVSPGLNPISASPAYPVSWDINAELSSPIEGKLTVTVSGWLVLPLTAEQKQMVAIVVATYKAAPGVVNQRILQRIQAQPRYAEDLEVTALNITRLDWDDAASKLTFAATLTVENPDITSDVQKELPATITTTGSGSIPTLTPTRPEDLEGLTFDFMFRVVARTVMAELQAKLAGLDLTIGFEFEFELRTDTMGFVTRTENTIEINFGVLRGPWPAYTPVQDKQFENLSFTLRVPAGAEVTNLPTGYTATDSAYTWRGSSAINAMLALITGEAGTRISYWVGPASVTVENTQNLVGQTIQIEKYYVENVEIASERDFAVNFEKDQPMSKVDVSLVAPVKIKVSGQHLPEKPPEVPAPPAERGLVCRYLAIETDAPDQVENATIEFRVPQLWVRVNDIDRATIRLLRYQDGQWVELDTTYLREDENNIYFSARTARFSVFAVTGAQMPTQSFVLPIPIWIVAVTAIALVVVLLAVVWRYLSRGGKV